MAKMKQQTQNNVTAVNGQWKGWWYGLSVLGAGEFGVRFRHVQPGSHPDSQVVSAHHALHTQVRSWSVQISSTRSGLHLSSEWVQVRVISLVLPASKTWNLIVVRLSGCACTASVCWPPCWLPSTKRSKRKPEGKPEYTERGNFLQHPLHLPQESRELMDMTSTKPVQVLYKWAHIGKATVHMAGRSKPQQINQFHQGSVLKQTSAKVQTSGCGVEPTTTPTPSIYIYVCISINLILSQHNHAL